VRSLLPWPLPQKLDELAPHHISVPSGSSIRLDYSESPPIKLSMFARAVRISPRRRESSRRAASGQAHLLSPARRPVQVTQDLANFWRSTYAEVKRI
jgi:ATP-dependent helicase HrpB